MSFIDDFADGGGGGITRSEYLTRIIPTALNDFVELGSFINAESSFAFDVQMRVAQGDFSLAKRFFVLAGTKTQHSAWLKVIPFALESDPASNDVDFEIQQVPLEGKIYLRLRRIAGTAIGAIAEITIFYDGVTTFIPLIGTGTAAPVIYTLQASNITQKDGNFFASGRIGVLTEDTSNGILTINGITGKSLAIEEGAKLFTLSAGTLETNDQFTLNAASSSKVGIGVAVPTAKLDVKESTNLAASLRVRTGIKPTVPNDGDFWKEVIPADAYGNPSTDNFCINTSKGKFDLLAPHLSGNFVYVDSLDDLPAPIAGKITLENKDYLFNPAGIFLPYTLVVPENISASIKNGLIIYIGGATIFETANIGTGSLLIDNCVLFNGSVTPATFFNMDGISHVDSFVRTDNSGIINFDNFGSVSNIDTFVVSGVKISAIGNGIALNHLSTIAFLNCKITDWKNNSTTMIDITGINGLVNISGNTIKPQSNEAAFNFDPTATFESGVVTSNPINLDGGAIFQAGSRDKTDINWTYSGNTNPANSTAFCDAYFLNNTEESFINAINAPIPINATWTDEVERFILDTFITYDTQTVNFTVGQVLTGSTSGATGTIIADDDQGTTGILTLNNVIGKFQSFPTGEIISDALGGSANISIPAVAIPAPIRGAFRYIGLETVKIKATANTQLRPFSGVAIPLSTYIVLNSSIIDKSESTAFVSSLQVSTIYSQVTILINTGDYVEVYVENEQTTSNIIVNQASFIVTKI